MTVLVAHAYAHVKGFVSVVKMVTVLEGCTTEGQHSVVLFCGQKDSVQRIFINKCFLFTGGALCYKREGRGLESQWGHFFFQFT
jgi:hypothetical protein